jgi:SAM-dependent methyltransferase
MSAAETQGELWSVDPAAWAARAETRNRPLFDALLGRLGPRSGERLLDVGCGAGLLCALAAERGCVVTGVDAAPGLLAHARERAPAATFVHGDLEALPFPDASFDVVTAVNVVPYARDRARAAAELARVTAPGGRVAATVGAGPEEQECARMVDPLAPPAEVPDWEHEVDVREPGALAALLAGAGLTVVADSEVAVDLVFAGVDDAVAAQLPAGPVEAAIRHSGRSAVTGALRGFFERRVRPDGTVGMRTVYRTVAALR